MFVAQALYSSTEDKLNIVLTWIHVPCKPLSDTKKGKTNKDETFDKDGGKCNLVGNHSYKMN